MKRVVCILLAALVLGAGVTGSVVAQSSGPTMEIEAGFDGRCRNNAWCPVRVILTNEGTDVEGDLRVVLPLNGGTDSNVYSRRVVLPAHSRKVYFLYLPAAGFSHRSRLTVQLIAGNETVVSGSATVLVADAADRLYGVVSGDPSALNFLSDVAPATAKAVVAQLTLDVLPPDPLGWEALDVLILNDVDTAALSGEQRRALETWVAHGGHVIVGGGVGAARTIAGLTTPTGSGQCLLPVTVSGIRQVDDLQALGEEIGATVIAGPFGVAEADLQDGKALIKQGDLVLLARRPYGAGRVDFLAFDAGLNPFTRWDDNTRLWGQIVEARATGAPSLTVREPYAAQRAVNAMPGLKFLSVLEILAFMLVYIALIGPVNYLLLRKFRRRELAWLTIPLIILGFTAFAYVTGFNIRGGAAIVHRLGVVYVPIGTSKGRVSEVVGLFSPRRTRYDVHAPGARTRPLFGGDYYYYAAPVAQPLHIVEDGEGATVTGLRVDVGGIQPFLVEGYTDVPGVEANLRLIGDDADRLWLDGDVRCGAVPLKDAVLIAGDNEQRLGDLGAGEHVSVRLSFSDTAPASVIWGPVPPLAPPGLGGGGTPIPIPTSLPLAALYPGSASNLPERILGPGDYWEDRELYRRYQFLQALFPYNAPGLLPSGVFLMGWVEENVPLPVKVVDRPFSEAALALYIYELPVAELETGEALIPPTLITRQTEGWTGYVNTEGDGPFYMDLGSEVTFRFTVWPEVMVSRVDELVLELQGSSHGSTVGAPVVSLWDWGSGVWREQDIGWGEHSIAEPARYVSRAGQVLVRLRVGSEFSVNVQSLTISLRGQR